VTLDVTDENLAGLQRYSRVLPRSTVVLRWLNGSHRRRGIGALVSTSFFGLERFSSRDCRDSSSVRDFSPREDHMFADPLIAASSSLSSRHDRESSGARRKSRRQGRRRRQTPSITAFDRDSNSSRSVSVSSPRRTPGYDWSSTCSCQNWRSRTSGSYPSARSAPRTTNG